MEMNKSPVKEQLDIIWRPHPILPAANCKFMQHGWSQGQTVRQILIANGVDQHQPISIIVNDRLLTVAEWDTFSPEPCSIINVKAEVLGGGGGGGGSNTMQIVAMIAIIAIAIAAPYALTAWGAVSAGTLTTAAGGLTLAGSLLTAGIMIAGNLLIGAIFSPKMSAVDMDTTSGSNTSSSPTYSLSGGSNRARPYEPMPVIMGTHRFFPDAAANPYTEYHGEDQYLYQIFGMGLSSATFSDFKIGTNPLSNYTDWSWQYPDQNGNITQFPGNVDNATGSALENSAGWVTRTTSTNTYKIGIDLEGVLFYANDRGGMDNTSVQIRIQYKPVGSETWIDPSDIEVNAPGFVDGKYVTNTEWVESGYFRRRGFLQTWVDTSSYRPVTRYVANGNVIIINGNSQSPRRATLFINPGATCQYDVRLIRDTADSTDSRLSNKVTWSTIKSYQVDDGSYIGQTRYGMTIRASEQLNGSIQQLSALGSARANYWNGTEFVCEETSNPAHWFMDFAFGSRDSNGKIVYGIGLAPEQIDYDQLLAWAEFCEAEGLTFNAVLDGTQTAADILTMISRCGFGSATWASGKLGAVWDARNQTPVAAFGMSNIIKGSFEVRYLTEQLADEIIVRFVDPDKDWNQSEVRVVVPGVENPIRSTTVDILGCTSRTMAGKFANYVAAQQYYRRRRITWDCDFEGFVCQRGDVVLLSHDLTQWGYSGRVVATSANTITFDREVPRNGTAEYMMLKRPDGTMTTYTVLAGAGNDQTVTLTTEPEFQEGYELLDHMWFFSPLATPGKKVKLISVQPISESRIQVVATDEDEAFYSAWDGDWIDPPQSTLLLNSVPVVSNIRVTENIYRGTDNSIKSHVSIIWDTNGVWERANIKYIVGNSEVTRLTTTGTKIEFDTANTGILNFEILPITGLKIGAPVVFNSNIFGVNLPLPNVTGLTDFYRDGKTVLTWRQVSDPRLIDYEIRKGVYWNKSEVVGRVATNEFISLGNGVYWIAAHHAGQYSPVPASIEIEGASLVANVIATWDEEATGWSGTTTGGAVVYGDDVRLVATELVSTIPVFSEIPSLLYWSGVNPGGTYEIPNDHIIDIGYSSACSVSVSYRLAADSPYNIFSKFPLLSTMESIVGNYAGFANVQIKMAIAPDSGVFGDWRDFVPGSYVGRKFKFRAVLTSSSSTVTAILDKFVFSVDVPDRVETGTGVVVPVTGSTVTYVKPFQITPNVQITIVAAQTGDDAVLTNETDEGFDVIVTDINDDPVERIINWVAQGY